MLTCFITTSIHHTLVLVSLLLGRSLLGRLCSVDLLNDNLPDDYTLVFIYLLNGRNMLCRLCSVCLLSNDLLLDGLSSILTVLYLADMSRLMDLLYGLTGSLVLTVLYLADRSSMDPVFMDPAFTLTVWTEALVRAVLPSLP